MKYENWLEKKKLQVMNAMKIDDRKSMMFVLNHSDLIQNSDERLVMDVYLRKNKALFSVKQQIAYGI